MPCELTTLELSAEIGCNPIMTPIKIQLWPKMDKKIRKKDIWSDLMVIYFVEF